MVAAERIKRAEAEEEVREANLEKEALRSALRLVERQSLESHSRSHSQANSDDFNPRAEGETEGEVTRSRSSSNVALKSPRASGGFGDEGDSPGPTSPVRAFSASAPFSSVPASPAPVSPAPLYVPPPREDNEGLSTHGRSQLAQSDVVDEAEVEAELSETSRDARSHSPVTTPRPSTPTHSHPDFSPTAPTSAASYSTSTSQPTPTSATATSATTNSPLPLPHPQLHRDRTLDRARSPSPALLNMGTNLEGLSTSPERKRTSLQKQPVAPPPSAVSEGMEAPWAHGEDEDQADEEEDDGREMTFTMTREGLDVESPWADR